jgi:hypothetical protein
LIQFLLAYSLSTVVTTLISFYHFINPNTIKTFTDGP